MALALSACGPGVVEAPRASGVSIVIKVDGSVPAQSRVVIDDQVVGALDFAAEHGVRVAAGAHRMTVTAPGYLPFDRAFEAAGKPVVITVSLRQSPD
jgi:hypothetical protein